MIYSASRRTDLPAFYPDYIVEKVRRSRKLEGIVFWSKDLRNFIENFGLQSVILNYPSIIQFTLTGLSGSIWEPDVPAAELQRDAICELMRILPSSAIRWRFDPIIVDDMVFERFLKAYEFLSSCGVELQEVTVSFPDLYRKVGVRLAAAGMEFPHVDVEQQLGVLSKLHELSGLRLRLCCEEELLDLECVSRASCIDAGLFELIYKIKIADIRKDGYQRAGCGCDLATDIGSYEMRCGHNCLYCYANSEE